MEGRRKTRYKNVYYFDNTCTYVVVGEKIIYIYAYSGEFDCTTPEDDDDGDVKGCVCVCVQYENRKSRGDLFIYCIYYHFFFLPLSTFSL